ncbi:MAG: cysteine--tRNA ligase [Desulfovibrionaceae bacterium]|nr:cysteine--tRNA ligase [Desulfovibrionaceae bacterium]
MHLYNTMTRRKEKFEPLHPGRVGMYACGITAYDYSHIGHARSAVVFDVLARYLRHKGYDVTFVRNFTDVDDKIIARANREGVSSADIAATYIAAFHEDMDRLGVRRADMEPRATEYIPAMLELCGCLIETGHAYAAASGDVYFRVRSFPSYGRLSGRALDDLRAGARVAPGEDKEDPLDFALWKAAKPGEPFWESPWGKGRPGWHIECSAMSEKNLPLPLDIHGGGQDLIFPHHENEIAQSEAALGKEFARFWVHNGFVQIDSEKMSKSLGNFKTIRDILKQRQPETLRFFLIGKHYRSPIDFSVDAMDDAERGLKRVYECLAEAERARARSSWKPGELPAELTQEWATLDRAFGEAMDDDCNTAAALGHVFGMVRLINRVLEDKALKNRQGTFALLEKFVRAVADWNAILGVFGAPPEDFLRDLRDTRARRLGLDMARVESLLAERAEARAARDFARADAARDALSALGVQVRDTPDGPVWDMA